MVHAMQQQSVARTEGVRNTSFNTLRCCTLSRRLAIQRDFGGYAIGVGVMAASRLRVLALGKGSQMRFEAAGKDL